MKTRYGKFFWFIIFAGTVLLSNTVFAQEGNRRYVYKDYNSAGTVFENSNHSYIIMPARAVDKKMVLVDASRGPGFGGSITCIRIEFKNLVEPPKWAGVTFPVESDFFGEEPEVSSSSVLDLRRARKLIFYARGERGGERIQVKAIFAGDKPYGDKISNDNSAPAPLPLITDWITLEREWKRYELQIDNPDQLYRVITPFAVITSLPYNPGGSITVYLDEIYYELES
jgi:hypothetical protein